MSQKKMGPEVMGPRSCGPEGWGPRRVGPRRVGPEVVGPRRVGPRRVGPRRVGPRIVEAQTRKSGTLKGGTLKSGGPKISRFFFLLRSQFSFFSPSLGGSFVEFWWCLKRWGPEMCTFGVLGLSCEILAAPKPPHDWAVMGCLLFHLVRSGIKITIVLLPGLHTTARELQTCTFEGPSLQKHHQNSTRKINKRGRKRMKTVAGEGRKRAKFWAVWPRGVRRRGVPRSPAERP